MQTKTRIDQKFASLRKSGHKAFIAYITAGDASLEDTYEHVLRLEDAGVDIVELGIPFSDPLADGRVNQESAMRALQAGTTIQEVFDTIARLRERTQLPIMSYCYMNLLYAPGFEQTVQQAAQAGMDGFLILDLPIEEGKSYSDMLHREGINNIVLITPTSPDERIKRIVRRGSGFVYGVSRTGVTGVQQKVAADAGDLIARARAFTKLPIALGFGIGNPEQAAEAARQADAVVVGSAIVKKLHEAGRSADALKEVGDWVASMNRAVKGV